MNICYPVWTHKDVAEIPAVNQKASVQSVKIVPAPHPTEVLVSIPTSYPSTLRFLADCVPTVSPRCCYCFNLYAVCISVLSTLH